MCATVKFTYKCGTSPAGSKDYGSIRYAVEVVAGTEPGLEIEYADTEIKRKRIGRKPPTFSVKAAATHKNEGLVLELTFAGESVIQAGLRLPRPWENKHNGLVERRRNDSLFILYMIEPTFKWEKGAPEWLVFDGKRPKEPTS